MKIEFVNVRGNVPTRLKKMKEQDAALVLAVSYTHLRAHETVLDLVCRLLLEKKKQQQSDDIPDQQYYSHNLTRMHICILHLICHSTITSA